MSLQKLFKPLPSLSIRPQIRNPPLFFFFISLQKLFKTLTLSLSDPKSQTQTPTGITTSEKEKMDKENTHRQSSELEEKNEEREVTMEREDGREGDGRDERTRRRTLPPFNQLSYHKFNESQREQAVLKRLQQGEIVAQICDAGTPGISDPACNVYITVKLCVDENIPVIPIPGPSAFVAALSASGLATDEFTFVGFLPKHAGSRKERLIVSAKEVATQIFYVPPHKLHQFIEEASSIFGDCSSKRSQLCATHEGLLRSNHHFLRSSNAKFWCGTLEEAKGAFLTRQPKGEITFLIEGKANCVVEAPSESQLENELRELISGGQCLSSVKLEGDIDQGVEYYKKALYYNWHYDDAMYNLGVAYGEMLKFDMGKMDVAASMIEKAIVANPTYAEAYNNLGVLYRDAGNITLAIESYEQCLKRTFFRLFSEPTFLDMYVKSVLNAKQKPAMGLSESFLPLMFIFNSAGLLVCCCCCQCAAAEFCWAAAAAAMLL
ncbi:hypothetical protein HYC85_009968 [Camellia sinensis]|uniref:Tetrapyrrole methylase domain-containing protein n=1 Tax=Camellia sinensis TaxID=4442 RepID=A0A7J7HJ61_CAMSI|nr:hypothetical protein HYC85_009968 [Camellia sinensis]